jgi:hypothetical protein
MRSRGVHTINLSRLWDAKHQLKHAAEELVDVTAALLQFAALQSWSTCYSLLITFFSVRACPILRQPAPASPRPPAQLRARRGRQERPAPQPPAGSRDARPATACAAAAQERITLHHPPPKK